MYLSFPGGTQYPDFSTLFEHVEFSAKEAVVTTEKRTWPNGAQGKKMLKTPLCGIDWIDDKRFENSKDFGILNLVTMVGSH